MNGRACITQNPDLLGSLIAQGKRPLLAIGVEVEECFPGGPVNTVDKVQTIHQVVVQGKEPVVSLHVYSRPIDSCVAFDLEQKRCYRRQLSFYSKYGQVVVRDGDLTPIKT